MKKLIQVCPVSKQYVDLVACAANCNKKCQIYLDNLCYSVLEEYVEQHPEFIIIGELMAKRTKKKTTKKSNMKKEKLCWVIDKKNQVTEVPESDILQNPQKYLDKKIMDKPTYKYDLVISLKRKRLKDDDEIL